MFFVDKYNPQNIKEIFFHKELFRLLFEISTDDAIPHIIFYGPDGSGKKTMISIFLELLYNSEVHKISNTIYNVNGSGNNLNEIIIKQSNYHIEINPSNTNFDRYLIQDVVKEYAKRMPLNIFTKKKIFKTVLIHNIDNLSYYAQTSLRRTMEKYSETCRFIMWGRSLSKIIEPLKSRCICINVKSPSNNDIFERIYKININENIKLPLKQLSDIVVRSKGNIKKSIWFLELSKYNLSYNTSYDDIINTIVSLLLSCNMESILEIRNLLYEIIKTIIDGTTIIKDIVIELCKTNILFIYKKKIINTGAKYEYRLILGRRNIIQLEAFITSIYNILMTPTKNPN
jgi:replication factor C subunit 3/5